MLCEVPRPSALQLGTLNAFEMAFLQNHKNLLVAEVSFQVLLYLPLVRNTRDSKSKSFKAYRAEPLRHREETIK